jgi:hypothetical protein
MSTKMAVFWVVAPCRLVKFTSVWATCWLHVGGGGGAGTRETLVNFYQLDGATTQKIAIFVTYRNSIAAGGLLMKFGMVVVSLEDSQNWWYFNFCNWSYERDVCPSSKGGIMMTPLHMIPCACSVTSNSNYKVTRRIFTKFGMDIIPFVQSLKSYVLISFIRSYQCSGL